MGPVKDRGRGWLISNTDVSKQVSPREYALPQLTADSQDSTPRPLMPGQHSLHNRGLDVTNSQGVKNPL